MKTTIIKQLLFASLLTACVNMMSSCDSCSRKDNNDTQTPGGMTDTDTVYNNNGSGSDGEYGSGTAIDRNNTSGTNGSSGTTTSGTGTNGSSSNGSATGGTSTSGKGATGTGTSGTKSLVDPNNDPIENTSSPSRDSKGRVINSGGTSGTGMGTGTGSTGNNSRVSKPEDQKN